MYIRTALPEDADELLRIYAPYVEKTAITFEYTVPTLEEFRGRIENTLKKYPYLVAVEGERIVGYAYAGVFHARAAYLHTVETSIYIDKDHHGKAIGRALYEELERILLSQNVFILYACISYKDRENDEFLTDGSVRFHEKMGYKLIGKHNLCGYKFDQWYSIVWMEKLIGEKPEHPKEFIPFCDLKKKVQVVSVKTMRDSDAYTIANFVSSKELMRRAGEGIFRSSEWFSPVTIICGKGNNAGDGFVVASYMKDAGISCRILLLSETFSEDGQYYFELAKEKGVPYSLYKGEALDGYKSIVDCIFGTGFSGVPKGPYATAIRRINESGAYIVSADINSGLNGDRGSGELYVKSDLTVSIGTFKRGHFSGDADKAMKKKVNVDIGITIIGDIEEIEVND